MATLTPEKIAKILEGRGFHLMFTVVDPGGLNKASTFSVTIYRTVNDKPIETNCVKTLYHKGAAHRRWSNNFNRTYTAIHGYWGGEVHRGKQVQLSQKFLNLKDPAQCKPEQRDHQQSIFDEFAQLTEPIPPTIDEVMYAMVMDAGMVRHGQSFKEFCDECGLDDDSIKAKESYDSCTEEWRAMVRLGVNFDAMDELFQDY